MKLAAARSSIVRTMKRVGFQIVKSTEDNPNPLIYNEYDFEVWVHYKKGICEGTEALYFEMKIEDGRVALYWQDFTHDTFVCYLDRGTKTMFQGLQKLYCHELDPSIAA